MSASLFQRKMARKLGALAVQIKEERRAAGDTRREKQELLRDTELRRVKVQARHDEIAASFFHSKDSKKQYIDEALEDLADIANVCEDLRGDIARLDTIIEKLNEYARPAEKVAERILEALNLRHEDFPEVGMAIGSLRGGAPL